VISVKNLKNKGIEREDERILWIIKKMCPQKRIENYRTLIKQNWEHKTLTAILSFDGETVEFKGINIAQNCPRDLTL